MWAFPVPPRTLTRSSGALPVTPVLLPQSRGHLVPAHLPSLLLVLALVPSSASWQAGPRRGRSLQQRSPSSRPPGGIGFPPSVVVEQVQAGSQEAESTFRWGPGPVTGPVDLSADPSWARPPAHRMPEGPELHLASRFLNEACRGLVFGGCVEKSPVSRNPEVPFESSAYCISSSARGKELRLTLSPLPGAEPPRGPLALVFRFGMSGSFQLAPRDALPAHAHLRFYTAPPGPPLALCFVDIRRFGHWDLGGEWQPGRGPCVLLEYEQFRENVLRNLADKVFDQPICEALLDQRFFNGIGNYLRAEILYRGQRLRAGERRGRLCRLSSMASVLRHARHELPAGPAWPDHLVPGGSWTPGTQSPHSNPGSHPRAGVCRKGAEGIGLSRPSVSVLQEASPARRNPREHSRGLSTERRPPQTPKDQS
ncbi:endonuclease 8-like 1 isoform X6 [Leptonychotes weddellii]|uniref:Endonuclease 8-like 1 isoform X6 n=1 Tax=Leptonychotes weddellii TaxID=9713 RepID=A0A7F8RTE9_LEPWE|nr:endonuclease 8-like 1 isoform X6 [Leptonychotes weddellii]